MRDHMGRTKNTNSLLDFRESLSVTNFMWEEIKFNASSHTRLRSQKFESLKNHLVYSQVITNLKQPLVQDEEEANLISDAW